MEQPKRIRKSARVSGPPGSGGVTYKAVLHTKKDVCGAVTVSFHICLSLLHSSPEKECQFVFILGFI